MQPGGILQRLKQRITERLEEDRLDQSLGSLAACPVGHRDAFFPDLRAALTGPVDPVKDLPLAVGHRKLGPPARAGAAGLFSICVVRCGLLQPPATHDRLTSLTRWRVIRP